MDSGNSFHVFDQGQFAKEVLPKYFKHNNMASFVRQLNMCKYLCGMSMARLLEFSSLTLKQNCPTPICTDGFRKVVHIEQGGLVKPERDDTEFQHPCFLRGQEQLLENIKRKVTSVSTLKNEDIKIRQDSVTRLLTDVQLMKGKQECMDSKLLAMKHLTLWLFKCGPIDPAMCCSENEALWREVASLRQKHAQQQKVVNKVGRTGGSPLMLSDSSSAHSVPKYGRQYSLEHVHGPGPYSVSIKLHETSLVGAGWPKLPQAPSPAYSSSSLYTSDTVTSSGPIISDITELTPTSPLASPGRSIDERPLSSSTLIRVKEEPPSPPRSPRVLETSPGRPSSMDTPLSPTAFIDSILRESEPTPAASNTASVDTTGAHAPTPLPSSTPEKCLSVACLDKPDTGNDEPGPSLDHPSGTSQRLSERGRNELSDHLDAMDSNLDNLQTMLTSHGFSVDTSALLDLFSPSVTMPDMSLPDLDSSLASIQELLSPQEPPKPIEAENSNPDSGKQLVHYTAQPLFLLDPDAVDTGNSELPVLFELGESSYFSEGDDYTDDPTISLLTGTEPLKAKDPTVS
ncbi:hypothetical protein U0070_015409 [Myodes glareolus]|uniref:HSF-type DNA-binding domain-containing protein n=1 Tax=Myodes glareolus TaxID=447135 RepID=A0AAW0HGI1_MYOGA